MEKFKVQSSKFKVIQKGATLVELLLYMGILLVLMGVLTTLFGTALDLQLESTSVSSVDRDSSYLLARMTYDFHRADTINLPASSGVAGTSLSLDIDGVTYIYSLDGSGNLLYTNDLGTFLLNSYDTRLSGLTFTKIANVGGVEDSVRVTFTLSSVAVQHKGQESKTIQTTMALR